MKHGRLEWLSPDELDKDARRVYEAIAGGQRSSGPQAFPLTDSNGRLHGPFNALVHAPSVGDAVQALGSAIRYGTLLADREREVAILALSARRQSAFEWHAHAAVGRLVGISEAELETLGRGERPDTLDARETIVYEVVRTLLNSRDLEDSLYARAVRALGEMQTIELVTLVGYYDLLALLLRTFRIPLPDGVSGATWVEDSGV